MTTGALLRLSQGSYEKAIVARNTRNRVLAMDLDGFFSRVTLAFFKADADGEFALSPRHTVLDIASTSLDSGKWGQLRAEASFLKRVLGLIRRQGVVAISANDPYISGFNAMVLSALTRIPYVIEIVANYDLYYRVAGTRTMPYLGSREAEKRVERLVLRRAHAIYADRDYYHRYALDNGANSTHCHRIRCVTDPFYYSAAPRHNLDDYFNSGGRRVLFHAGRLHPEKCPMDLIDCLVATRAAGEDVVLAIAGDGVQRVEMERRAEDLGVRDSLVMLGNRSSAELVDLMHHADVLLATHAGYALIEMALSATPIVAYDYEWHPELVRHEETGLLAPYRNAQAMSAQVLRLLRDRELGRRLGAAARQFAFDHHDCSGAIRDEQRIYEGLLGAGPTRDRT